MDYYFTSDTHFNHSNIAGPRVSQWSSGYRNFNSTEEMNETLIANWNSKVKPGDIVYHMGDVAFATTELARPLIRRLNGQKYLCIGNHEKAALGCRDLFVDIRDYREVNINGQKIIMFHYPIESWNHMRHGSWMVHGHCHYSLPESPAKKIDIGVDNPIANYGPLSFDELKVIMDKRGFQEIDHHIN